MVNEHGIFFCQSILIADVKFKQDESSYVDSAFYFVIAFHLLDGQYAEAPIPSLFGQFLINE